MPSVTGGLVGSVLVVLGGLSVTDVALSRYAQVHFGPNRLLRAAVATGDRCVLTIGDSRMEAGVDPESLIEALDRDGRATCVASLGIGAVGLEGQSLALRRYLSAPRHPLVVVLGVGLLLPGDSVDPSQMVGNAALELAWSNAADVATFFPGFPLRDFDPGVRFSIERTNAMQSYASLIWAKVQGVQTWLTSGQDGVGPSNKFGLLDDMNKLAETFARDAGARLERWQGDWRESSWFEYVDQTVRQRGAKLVVVHVPMNSAYRRRVNDTQLWGSYSAWLAKDLAKRGDAFVDLSASVDDARFGDGVHVDRDGAALFSRALGQAVRSAVAPPPF
jgi:hypothetical protein